VDIVLLNIPLYTCPICGKKFSRVESRIEHEKRHILPAKFTKNLSDHSVSSLENTMNTEQQEFLGYFNLVKQIHLNFTAMDRLATRKNLLKALKCAGNAIGSYNCHHCE
jgi:hypothetical protein